MPEDHFDERVRPSGARQGLISHHYWIEDGKVDVISPPFRYVWPSELDLMARLAGMRLRERWGDWRREPFTADSPKHVPSGTTPRPTPRVRGVLVLAFGRAAQ
jgi:hypothetical protein